MLYVTGSIPMSEVGKLVAAQEFGLQDPVTHLRSQTRFGRPDLHELFSNWTSEFAGMNVGMFYCGPERLGEQLEAHCNESRAKGLDIEYFREIY